MRSDKIFYVASTERWQYDEHEVYVCYIPVDESELVDGVDGEGGLGDVELSALLAQRVLLHQQRHHVACKRKKANWVKKLLY